MKNLRTAILSMMALTMIISFTACEEEDMDNNQVNPTYDCPDLQLDYGDICLIIDSVGNGTMVSYGLVDQDCACILPDTMAFDCPDILANVGDPCLLDSVGGMGIVQADCSCTDLPPNWDCWDLQLNIGDSCSTLLGGGIVNDLCECEVDNNNTWDCPGIQMNIGDSCATGTGTGVINAACECEVDEPVWDCPGFMGNVGDPCQGGWGIITADCDCIENNAWDCPGLQGNIGDVCVETINGVTYAGFITDSCECSINALFDCPDFFGPGAGANIGDSCSTGFFPGIVNQDCECE